MSTRIFVIFFVILLLFFLVFNLQNKPITNEKETYNAKVAVIDSGFDNVNGTIDVKEGVSFITINYNDYSDESGHGTKIVNLIHDVNPNTEFYIIKSLNEDTEGNTEDIIKGIEWAIKKDVDILNMSISSYQYSESLEKAIEMAVKSGIILVAPSGNEGYSKDGNISYPAKFDSVISVGSVDSNLQRSDFSNVGFELDFMIQGENINVKNMYGLEESDSGTSFSSAYVCGIVSKIINFNPSLNIDDIYSILENSAVDKGNKFEYGKGILKENLVFKHLNNFIYEGEK